MRTAGGRYLTVVGRLREGRSVAQAHDEMARLGDTLAAENKDLNAGWGVNVQPLHADLVRQVRPGLALLLAAVVVLLLIACVNVANLLLARAVARERELAIRAALGAGRGRLLRQLLTESLVLAALAGAAGAALGRSLLEGIQLLLPPEIAEVVAVRYDLRAVAGAVLLSLACALVFGGVPALQAARIGLVGALKEGGAVRGSGRSRGRLKRGLVVAEVALSALMLVATGLLLRSFLALSSVSPGFESEGVLAAGLSPGGPAYRDRTRVQSFYRDLLERLRGQPGVSEAAAISWTPLGSGGAATGFTVSGREAPLPGQEPVADIRVVTPGLFRTLRIPLLAGRDLSPDDRAGTPRVAVIGESLARELGAPGAALGQRLKLRWGGDPEVEVVGVVGDVHLASLDSAPRATVYLPHAQDGNNFMTLMLRTSGPPLALVPGVRAAVASLDPALPVGSALPLDEVVSHSLRSRRFVLVLVGVFGALALALAGIGLFGVMAYLVAQRTSELGVRLVLGARPRDVLRLVVGDGMRLVGLGLVLGLAGGLLASRALESQLFAVRPWDPWALAGVALSLSFVALVALATPALARGPHRPHAGHAHRIAWMPGAPPPDVINAPAAAVAYSNSRWEGFRTPASTEAHPSARVDGSKTIDAPPEQAAVARGARLQLVARGREESLASHRACAARRTAGPAQGLRAQPGAARRRRAPRACRSTCLARATARGGRWRGLCSSGRP